MKKSKLLFYALITLMHQHAAAQMITNNYMNDTTAAKRLQVQRSMVYTPQHEWLYSHHPSVAHFKNRFFVIWSNGMKDEDRPGQRVVYSTSNDFVHWSAPKVLTIPSVYKNDTLNIFTAAGFYQFNDTLVAYYSEYSPQRTNTSLWAKYTTNGEQWSNAINMHVPVNPNHGPEKIADGRLIISGNFSFPYTDDHTGLSGWKMASFYPDSLYKEDNPATFYQPAEASSYPPLCEGSFFQTNDNVLHMLLRVTGKGWRGKLWQTNSNDNGEHWTAPVETSFTDNDSKFHFGQLPDGRFYYVGIPDTLHHYERNPLVLSLSNDGILFNQHYIIADELYQLRAEGLYKGGQYGYPHTMIYNNEMYIVISRQKEAIEIIRFALNQLK